MPCRVTHLSTASSRVAEKRVLGDRARCEQKFNTDYIQLPPPRCRANTPASTSATKAAAPSTVPLE